MPGIIDFLKNNALHLLIILLLIVILVMIYSKEGYIGNPLSHMPSWDSGGILRRSGTMFSSTNQGLNQEGMTGSRDPPSYTAPWYTNYDYAAASLTADTSSADVAPAGAEHYSGAFKIEDKNLVRKLY